jgi:hypothetical protein
MTKAIGCRMQVSDYQLVHFCIVRLFVMYLTFYIQHYVLCNTFCSAILFYVKDIMYILLITKMLMLALMRHAHILSLVLWNFDI